MKLACSYPERSGTIIPIYASVKAALPPQSTRVRGNQSLIPILQLGSYCFFLSLLFRKLQMQKKVAGTYANHKKNEHRDLIYFFQIAPSPASHNFLLNAGMLLSSISTPLFFSVAHCVLSSFILFKDGWFTLGISLSV